MAMEKLKPLDVSRRTVRGTSSQSKFVDSWFFLKKFANPGLFFIYFCLFKHKLPLLHQINVNKCSSSIKCRDSNSWSLEHESPPITTRPGLLPLVDWCFPSIEVGETFAQEIRILKDRCDQEIHFSENANTCSFVCWASDVCFFLLTQQPARTDVGLKCSPISPKSSYSIFKNKKWCFSKQPKKSPNIWAT